MSYSMTAV